MTMFSDIDKNAFNWRREFSAVSQVIAIEEQATDVIKTGRFVLKLEIYLNDFNYEHKLYDLAFLKNSEGFKGDIFLDHTDTIQKLLNKKEMITVLENNEITLRSHWDAQIHMEISEKIWGLLLSFSYWGSQRYLILMIVLDSETTCEKN